MARSGLKKVVKTVKGKKGTVKRSYWVKAQGAAGKAKKAVGGFARRHSTALKVVGGVAALAGLAYGAHRAGSVVHGVQSARANFANNRQYGGGRIESALTAVKHGASQASQHEGSLLGRNLAGLASYGARTARNAASMKAYSMGNTMRRGVAAYRESRAGGGGLRQSARAALGA